MSSGRFNRLCIALAVLCLGVAFAFACIPVDAADTVAVTTEVRISIKVKQVGDKKEYEIVADPMVALVKVGGRLAFQAVEAGDLVLELDFNVTGTSKGPFSVWDKGERPVRGRIQLTGNERAEVGYDKALGEGIWKYEIVLRDKNGKDLAALDPAAVGKGGM